MSTRRRRTPEEARREILDAAEARLRAAGPEAIRLEAVARDVGLSHPAILHHFGTREGMLSALVARAIDELDADLRRALAGPVEGPDDVAALLDGVFRVLGERGHARLIAWLILSGRAPEADRTPSLLAEIADRVHALRCAERSPAAGPLPEREDTLFTILLVAVAIFGEGIAGPLLRERAGLGEDAEAPGRFRRWLAELLLARLG